MHAPVETVYLLSAIQNGAHLKEGATQLTLTG